MVGGGRQVRRGIDKGAVEIEHDGGVGEIEGHGRCSRCGAANYSPLPWLERGRRRAVPPMPRTAQICALTAIGQPKSEAELGSPSRASMQPSLRLACGTSQAYTSRSAPSPRVHYSGGVNG